MVIQPQQKGERKATVEAEDWGPVTRRMFAGPLKRPGSGKL
jgi:hypothetical protein